MIKLFKRILKPLIPKKAILFIKRLYGKIQIIKWQKTGFKVSPVLVEWQISGCPIPPPHLVKQITIQEYQKKYGYRILIETGTYLGDMVEAQKRIFRKVISIELGSELFEKAQLRFLNDKNVTIIQGDSGKQLRNLLKDIDEPSIFWLDGHYSSGITAKGEKECPIYEELDAILNQKKYNHVILIDDARCFVGERDFPTQEELTRFINSRCENYKFELKNDIIRYYI